MYSVVGKMRLVVIALFGAFLAGEIAADDPNSELSTDLPVRERKLTSRLNEAELKRWSFATKNGNTLSVSEPVMRWSHYDIGRYYGDLHVVTANERPVAIFAMFRWFHPTTPAYFCATALDDSGVIARKNGTTIWRPSTSSVDWKPLPNARPPGRSAASRLVHMRRYARRFSGEVSNRPVADRNTFKTLRLLPQPIYRYSTDVVDGAIFAFSEGTNPAVLVCLEADLDPAKPTWRYGIARRWSFESHMSFDNQEIWTAPSTRPRNTNSTSPYLLTLIPNGT